MIWGALIKTALVRLGRAVFGEAAGDIPLDLTELAREAEDAMRPRGPNEPSQPLAYRDVERQRAQAAQSARPPPLPEPPQPAEASPELAWVAPFPATFPVTDVSEASSSGSPFPETLRPPSVVPLRTADTVRPPVRPGDPRPQARSSRPPPPSPAMPRAAPRPLVPRADKRLPPVPPRKPS